MQVKPSAHPLSVPLFTKWKPIISTHKAKPRTEIEIRFGRVAGSGFDTNVGKEAFSKVQGALEKYDGWASTKHSNATVYYFNGSKRLTVDEDTDEQVGQIKKRICVNDFQLDDSAFDVRLGVSSEEPWEYDDEEVSTKQKTKERWSFVRKNLSIDLSIIKGTPDDHDSDEDTAYQIELEIIDPSKVESDVELFNLLHKVFDVLNCV
jgi:hypothetical protein